MLNRKGEPYTSDRFRTAWADFMTGTPAGRIREEGFVFHGLRASSCEKLREAGCGDREIESYHRYVARDGHALQSLC